MNQDEQQLDLLKVFYFVLAGLQGLAGCIPLVQLGIGAAVFNSPAMQNARNPPPDMFGWLFVGIALVIMVLIWTMAIFTYVAGRRLGERRSYVFCMVMAVVLCVLYMPLGTVLGVFTIIVLQRPSVKARFAA